MDTVRHDTRLASTRLTRRWWLGVTAAVVAGIALAIGAERASERYVIAFDVQKYYSCLPFDLFVIDTAPQTVIRRGSLVQFEAPKEAQKLTKAFTVVKYVAGVAGDRWTIREDELWVNGQLWGRLYLLPSLGLPPGALDGEGVVGEGELYVLGTTPSSYDSRYWGPLATEQVRGVAHVVL